MVYSWLIWRVYMAVAHLANNYLILFSYFLWNNPTDFLLLLVMHVCVCLLFPSLCLRMWSFGNYKKRSSISATMDRFPAIFLSSLNLMTANTASHGFGLNLLRATWSQVSFPFTITSVCDVPSPHDSHIPCLCLTSYFLTIRLLPSLLYIGDMSFMCPISPLSLDGILENTSVGSYPHFDFPLELSVVMCHLLLFRWDSGHFPWCVCQQRLCDHPELRGR